MITIRPLHDPFNIRGSYNKNIVPLVGAALVSGAASLIGGGISGLFGKKSNDKTNETNLQIARETNQTNVDLAREQRAYDREMWDLQNQYNDPSAQMQRMVAAGINPYIASGSVDSGSATSSAGGQTAPTMVAPQSNYTANNWLSGGLNGLIDGANTIGQSIIASKEVEHKQNELRLQEIELQKQDIELTNVRINSAFENAKTIALQESGFAELDAKRQTSSAQMAISKNTAFLENQDTYNSNDVLSNNLEVAQKEENVRSTKFQNDLNEFQNLPLSELSQGNNFRDIVLSYRESHPNASDSNVREFFTQLGTAIGLRYQQEKQQISLNSITGANAKFDYQQKERWKSFFNSEQGIEYVMGQNPNLTHDQAKKIAKGMALQYGSNGFSGTLDIKTLLKNSFSSMFDYLSKNPDAPIDEIAIYGLLDGVGVDTDSINFKDEYSKFRKSVKTKSKEARDFAISSFLKGIASFFRPTEFERGALQAGGLNPPTKAQE